MDDIKVVPLIQELPEYKALEDEDGRRAAFAKFVKRQKVCGLYRFCCQTLTFSLLLYRNASVNESEKRLRMVGLLLAGDAKTLVNVMENANATATETVNEKGETEIEINGEDGYSKRRGEKRDGTFLDSAHHIQGAVVRA